MVFHLQPAPATRSFIKNKQSPLQPRPSHSSDPTLVSSDTSPRTRHEVSESDRTQSQTTSRFQEHFSWGTLPGTASLWKPGGTAYALLDEISKDDVPQEKNSGSNDRREESELPGTSGSETEVDSEVEPIYKLKPDLSALFSNSDQSLKSPNCDTDQEDNADDTSRCTPIPLTLTPGPPRNSSTASLLVRDGSQRHSNCQSRRGSLKTLDEGFKCLPEEKAERALLNARLSANAGSAATSRRGGDKRSWNEGSFTSARRTSGTSSVSTMRRRSSVKSPTSAELQILSFGDHQEDQRQKFSFDTPRYDYPASNLLSLPSASSVGPRHHTSLLLPPFSPTSPRSAAAQQSPLAPSCAQSQHHLSIGTAPLSATLVALGVNREAQHYSRGSKSSPSDDDDDDDAAEVNPRWSVPFWARRSHLIEQQLAVEKNKKVLKAGKGLPRVTQPGEEPISPNGGILEMSTIPDQSTVSTSTKLPEVPPPTRHRGAIESTVRAGRLAAGRLSTSLASYISGYSDAASGSRKGMIQGWKGALPYNKEPFSLHNTLSGEKSKNQGKSDGWGGSRASWFPSSKLGPLVSPAPNAVNSKASPRLKTSTLSPDLSAIGGKYSGVSTNSARPALRVHFAPSEHSRSSEEGRNDADWIDEDEAQELFETPLQQVESGSKKSSLRIKRSFDISVPFRRKSIAGSPRSPTSPFRFFPPPPDSSKHGFAIGAKPKVRSNSNLEENLDDGVAVTYRSGSAEGRPFKTLQQVRTQRKKTAIRRMAVILAALASIAVLINIIILDVKLLSVKTTSLHDIQDSSSRFPAPLSVSDHQSSATSPSEAAVATTSDFYSSKLGTSLNSTTSSLGQFLASPTSIADFATPTSTPPYAYGLSTLPTAPRPVTAAVQMAG